MTADQFDALATLLQLRQGPARAAARHVLVEGMRQADAAALAGISAAAMSNALTRIRRGIELAKVAAGACN